MKIFRKLTTLGLPADQSYFLSCWYNMVHVTSLDSHRARVMNPENTLKEVRKNIQRGNGGDRMAVFTEAAELLQADPVLKTDRYKRVVEHIVSLLSANEIKKEEGGGGPASTMALYLISEVEVVIRENYIEDCLQEINSILLEGSLAALSEFERFKNIRTLACNLLSTLIFRGWSLESLHQVFMVHVRSISSKRTFARQWVLTHLIITRPPREYQVVISLDQVTAKEEFPLVIGKISFSALPQVIVSDRLVDNRSLQVRAYLIPGSRRLFASLNIFASDERSAGSIAVQRLNDVLNLVRFEYERARVRISDSFVIRYDGQPARLEVLPSMVPNPTKYVDGAGLEIFVKAVDGLVDNKNFTHEGLDRIYAAFRLYRTGLDTSILENKFTNWWTAMEYLVRGSTSDSKIGNAVENNITPVLCLSYLIKHLNVHKDVLVELNVRIIDPQTQLSVDLKSHNSVDLYQLFRREDIQQLIYGNLSNEPYVLEQFQHFFGKLKNPTDIHKLIELHAQRVRWQLQRLWRSRCDIVHSADRQVGLVLLCANLEYYLKTTLENFLKSLRTISTLSGPKEFFDRQQYEYSQLLTDLKSGKDSVLLRVLKQDSV